MKKKYIKPEVITQDFSLQIFLQTCYTANDGPGLASGECWEPSFGCDPCTFPGQVNLASQHPHP